MLALRRLFPTAFAVAISLALVPATAEAKSQSKKTTTVECKDGTTSKAGRGACSHHGGVAAAAKDQAGEKTAEPAARSASAPDREPLGPQGRAAPRSDRATSENPSSNETASVKCTDGTTSKAGRGACSHHGGVAGAANDQAREETAEPAARSTPSPERALEGRAAPSSDRATSMPNAGQPTARCKDGTMSYAKQHSGACSHHGGVAEWLR
jgi:hypothetical protein